MLDEVELPWRTVDLTDRADDVREAELADVLADEQARRFDMETAPLMRFLLVRSGADRYHLAVTSHHILLDGWSMPLLMQDLMALYVLRGDRTVLPRVRSYRNFLAWLAEQDHAASLDAWAQTLQGLSEPTVIAPVQRDPDNETISKVSVLVDTDHTARLTMLATELGVTVNTLVQAAWGVLLGRITGNPDIVFGATVSGRPADLPGVESMVGLFINTLPVRVRSIRTSRWRSCCSACSPNRPVCSTTTTSDCPRSNSGSGTRSASTHCWCSSRTRSTARHCPTPRGRSTA